MKFTERLRYYRSAAGLSQEALAAACGFSGQSRIGNYESGLREPSLDDLQALSSALSVSVSALVDDDAHLVSMPLPGSKSLTLHVPEHIYQKLLKEASENGQDIKNVATSRIEASFDSSERPQHPGKTVEILETLLKAAERMQLDLQEKDDIIKAQKGVISRKK